jgi:hypothetical protein
LDLAIDQIFSMGTIPTKKKAFSNTFLIASHRIILDYIC